MILSFGGVVSKMGNAIPLLPCAQRGALSSLGLVFTVASLATAGAAPTGEVYASRSSWVDFIDGGGALILGLLWALRTFFLSQSYSSSRAPCWYTLRFLAFWSSVIAMVGAIVAMCIGWWNMGGPRPATMSSVVAVVVGAFITVAVEKRSQGLPSTNLRTLQKLLRRPFYRAGNVGVYGYKDKRTALFEESVSPPGKSTSNVMWVKSTWSNTAVPNGNTWTYYVKPGPINDHCYLGRYEVLENAAGGNDPISFAAAFASVTAAYLARLSLTELQDTIIQLIVAGYPSQNSRVVSETPLIPDKTDSTETELVEAESKFEPVNGESQIGLVNTSPSLSPTSTTKLNATKTQARSRVTNSLRSWRPRALARHLLGNEDFNFEKDELDSVQSGVLDKLSADKRNVLWAVCWLEEGEYLGSAMDAIADYLKDVHADGRVWNCKVVEGELKDLVHGIMRQRTKPV